MSRSRSTTPERSPDDFWLIDSEQVGFTLADQDGRAIGGVGVSTDPRLVDYCRDVRKRLWPLATPYDKYIR
ncbi:DUF6879 family protein [Nocardia sp. NPDC049149]|uniref:DUF6879 family protein n=1 Tax=Nocardia sp. NPDC049149 TaxID=3364315 RepID=UPI00371E14C0